MLYPDFHELVALRAKVSSCQFTARKVSGSVVFGDYISAFRGQGSEFEEVRRYARGDDVRQIHWKVTARTRIPYVKSFSVEKQRRVFICHDLNGSMRFGTRGTFKSVQAAYATALLGWSALENTSPVGAILFGDIYEGRKLYKPSAHKNCFLRILRQIADMPIRGDHGMLQNSVVNITDYISEVIPSGALVVIVSDFVELSEKFYDSLAYLRGRCDVVLICINDPTDMDLPNCGEQIFTDGLRSHAIDLSDRRGRAKYHMSAAKNFEQLDNFCKSNGISNIMLLTNSDIHFDLFEKIKAKSLLDRRQ